MRSCIATVVMSAAVSSQAWAAQPLDQLLACRPMPDAAARLECFDRAADAASSGKMTEATPPPSTSAAPSTPATSSMTATHPVAESRIVQISPPVAGRVDFTLENGQVWRQTDAETAKSAKIGDKVVVSKAFWSAYWLKIKGGHSWRVTPVR